MTQEPPYVAEPSPRQGAIWPLIALAVLAAGAALVVWHVDPTQTAIPVCGLYRVAGLHCPGCGATRATHQLLHGQLLLALRCNALWIVLIPVVLYGFASEFRRQLRGQPLPGDLFRRGWFVAALLGVAIVFFVLRNVPAYPLTLLAPPS